MRWTIFGISAATFFIAAAAALPAAEEQRCAHCGCTAACQKICRLVRDERTVEETCWGCVCEDFCLPCPGSPAGKERENICESPGDPHDPKVPCARSRKLVWHNFLPNGATMHSRKRLMKKVVAKKVPSYRYVVENVCPACAANLDSQLAPMPAATTP